MEAAQDACSQAAGHPDIILCCAAAQGASEHIVGRISTWLAVSGVVLREGNLSTQVFLKAQAVLDHCCLQGQDAPPRGNHHRSSSSHAALNSYGSPGPAARGGKHERGASAGGGPILDSAFGSRSGKVGGLKGKPLSLATLAPAWFPLRRACALLTALVVMHRYLESLWSSVPETMSAASSARTACWPKTMSAASSARTAFCPACPRPHCWMTHRMITSAAGATQPHADGRPSIDLLRCATELGLGERRR